MRENDSIRKSAVLAVPLLLSMLAADGTVSAQSDEMLRLPMQLDADSTSYDGKSSMLMFRGLRLSQGTLGIAAGEGRATKMDFEDSVWKFDGGVVIDVDNGHIESDSAEMQFSGYQLRYATIVGSPATFRLVRPGSDQETYAEAGRLNYDLDSGEIEFSGQATITENGNQIASDYLVYNISERRVNATSKGDPDSKVRVIYTPGNASPADSEDGAADQATENRTPAEDDTRVEEDETDGDSGEPHG